MANGYDGDIKLSVSLSPEEAQQSAKRLQKEIQDIFNKTSGQNLDSSFQKLLTNMSKATSRSEALQKSLEKVSNTQVQTKEYTKLENTISSLESKIESAKVKQAQFLEAGGKESSRTFENMNSNIAMLEDKLFDAQRALQTLVDEGKQFTINEDGIEQAKNALADNNNQLRMMIENAAQYQGTMSEASQQNAQKVMSTWERVAELFKRIGTDIRHPIQAIQRLRENSDDAGKSAEQTATKFSRFSGVTSSVGSVLSKVGSALKTLAQRFLHVGNASKGFDAKLKRGFWNIMKYGLGIRSLYVLFRRLRSSITESLTTMAMMNGGVNQTNTAISALVSSLNYLKGALGAAFAPILTVVSPILSNLIDQIASVINAIGMMIAKLTGAKSYFRATKTSTNYAASKAGGGGSSKKSAEERYQEAVEKAQKKYDEQVAKTQEKNAKAAAKAEERQAKAAKKLAEQQEKANRKLADFDDLNVLNIEDMEELEEIEADVYDMPELELPDREDFEDALGGGGAGDPFGLEEIPLDDFEWNWDELLAKAEELGRGLADMLNKIFADEELAQKIGNAIGNLINMAIRFAYGFVDEFNFRQFGRWIGTLIQEAIETIEWDTLGKTIGKLVNGIADTIIGFFERYNVGTLGQSIATMFNNAINEIDTDKVGEAIGDVLGAPIAEFTAFLKEADIRQATEKAFALFERILTAPLFGGEKTLGYIIGEGIAAVLNAAFDVVMGSDVSGAVSAVQKFLTDIFRGAFENLDFISYLEAVAIYCIEQAELIYNRIIFYIREILNALSFLPGELGELASQGAEALNSVNTKFDEAKQAVHELADSYREELPSSISEAKDALLENSNYIKVDSENTAKKVDQDFKNMGVASNAFKTQTWNDMLEATNSINEYSTNTNTQLDGVQTKSQETAISLEDMSTSVNESLVSLTTTIDTWYQDMVLKYFSYDTWLLLLQEGPLLALTDFFTGEGSFLTTWDNQMQEWWENHVKKPWFTNEKWNAEVYVPWETYRNTKWSELMKWWDSMMKSWWDTKVVPWFKEDKWQEQFDNIKKAAEKTGKETQKIVTEFANDTADAIVEACDKAIEAIEEVISKLNEALALASELENLGEGGGGSSSSSGRNSSNGGNTSPGGGGGHIPPFMPALDIMHFEDNLGMSAFKFPELATGAVIPPNNKFLAVLGDQKSGMNIETPLATMVEAFRSVMDEYMNPAMRNATMEVDGETFARLMMPHMMDEANRLGYNTEIIEGI